MYQEMELWVPYYRLREEGAEVKVVGADGARSYASKHGYPVTVDVQADQVKAVEFDAVVVPGGYAPDMMRRPPALVALVREAAQQGKVVAAICHAGWMLVSAGVLKGRKATSFFSIKDDLVGGGGGGPRGGGGPPAPPLLRLRPVAAKIEPSWSCSGSARPTAPPRRSWWTAPSSGARRRSASRARR